jgi:hypothetical protein
MWDLFPEQIQSKGTLGLEKRPLHHSMTRMHPRRDQYEQPALDIWVQLPVCPARCAHEREGVLDYHDRIASDPDLCKNRIPASS